jgi:glycosyltransferase involved in cell wall biosynthesis|uniref:glycosyltransferase family 4 protein n=1 Tax=Cephaloticoccus sp. TaxID=1985742 RepID=UPI004048F0FF
MKLAIVTETFPPEVNGVAMTFRVIARELAQRGHQVTVFRPKRTDLSASGQTFDYTEVQMPGMPIPGYPLLRLGLPARRRLVRHWKSDRPDLVHVVTEGPLGASAVSAARAMGLPVTSSFHTNFHAYTHNYGFGLLYPMVLGWLRRVHNRTQRTFAPTDELCAELRNLGFRNMTLLSRGVDTDCFSPTRRSRSLRESWGAGPDDPVVLHVGRMAPEKNYGLLFKCYEAMRHANPRLRFVLAGDGPMRDSLIKQHPECHFAGFYSRQEIGRYYASADIYIHPSLTETFGNVLTEAMASGLAVSGFDYAAARQFIQHRQNGLVVPCDKSDELIAAAVELACDQNLRAELRQAARESFAQQSWSNVIGRFEDDLIAVTKLGFSA